MKRRTTNVFSLSFLDALTCGLGAVILLYVIINARGTAYKNEVTSELRGEVNRREREVLQGRKNLIEARNTYEQVVDELAKAQGLSRQLIKTIEEKKVELASYENETLAFKEHINRLKADIKSLEEGLKRLEGGSTSLDDYGSRIRRFPGEGDRQYLTDLKMGGERIFILVDTSASMLDDTIIGIIRRRNLDDEQKIRSAKWQHLVSSVDWLVTQLPLTSKFQIYTFNETAMPLMEGTEGKWLEVNDAPQLNNMIYRLRRVVPQKGTSLVNAFLAARGISPQPDNIFLLTDSLPTMGREKSWKNKVSGKKRLSLFSEAVSVLPPNVPVNIILYHMEGDPAAASSYWQLAMITNGSLFSPSRDWP
ncbi:MAG: VWA domain-containing protein [Candidatus Kuenenia sp.]|nr:VWA domain-containing protein [Candidatus Kuenenia hertensis]